ncbi:MAG: glutathione S-transferase [Deltaproteobacteria bacterium]|nr:glutathione S-transferase [Deltaproteobacteria bacterium]
MPTITALSAGLIGLISIVISVMVGRVRGRPGGVSIGDGGKPELILAMRRHANFVEVVPLALIRMALLEMNKVQPNAIHCLGAVLVIGRACHAYGFGNEGPLSVLRAVGAVGSLLVTVVASTWAISIF